MITDGVQMSMAWSQVLAMPRLQRPRTVEAVTPADQDSEGEREPASAAMEGEAAEAGIDTVVMQRGVTLHFVYHTAVQNGRPVAKRRPQLADSRYWCWVFDTAG